MSFVEVTEEPKGFFFTQLYTCADGEDIMKLLKDVLKRSFLDFFIVFKEIERINWKHIYILEQWQNKDQDYYQNLFPLWFRQQHLQHPGNGLSCSKNTQEYCGSPSGEKPSLAHISQMLLLKQFLLAHMRKTKQCKDYCAQYPEKDLHTIVSELEKIIDMKGGAWCLFPDARGSISESKILFEKTVFTFVENIFSKHSPMAWRNVWRISLRVSKHAIVAKVANNVTNYFTSRRENGHSEIKKPLWYYRKDLEVREIFNAISKCIDIQLFKFKYKPIILSMCGIRRENRKNTVLTLYSDLPIHMLIDPFIEDSSREFKEEAQFGASFVSTSSANISQSSSVFNNQYVIH